MDSHFVDVTQSRPNSTDYQLKSTREPDEPEKKSPLLYQKTIGGLFCRAKMAIDKPIFIHVQLADHSLPFLEIFRLRGQLDLRSPLLVEDEIGLNAVFVLIIADLSLEAPVWKSYFTV